MEGEGRGIGVLKTVAIAVGILMAVLPAAAAALFGIHGLFQYKWILGAAEMVLLAVEVFLLSGVRPELGKERRIPGGRRRRGSRGGDREKDRTMGGYILGKRRRMRGEFPAGLLQNRGKKRKRSSRRSFWQPGLWK